MNRWWIRWRWGIRWVLTVKPRGNTEHVMHSVWCHRPDGALIMGRGAEARLSAQRSSWGTPTAASLLWNADLRLSHAPSHCRARAYRESWTPSLFCSFSICDNPNYTFSRIHHGGFTFWQPAIFFQKSLSGMKLWEMQWEMGVISLLRSNMNVKDVSQHPFLWKESQLLLIIIIIIVILNVPISACFIY